MENYFDESTELVFIKKSVCVYVHVQSKFPCKSGKILTFYESLNIHEVKSFFCFYGFIFFFNSIISNIFGITKFF